MPYTKNISLRDFYQFYKDNCIKKGLAFKFYPEYSKLLKDFNKRVRHKIIYEGGKVQLPYRLGELYVKKFDVYYDIENQKGWKVNFKASKEANMIIYYGSPYGYKWQWNKKKCIVKGKKYYNFKPCRAASRMIADAVNNKKLDFYNQ